MADTFVVVDARQLPFIIASGIILAYFAILLCRLGMNIFRNNTGWRGLVGAVMFFFGLVFSVVLILAAADV
ncbi:hypothetical protein [Pararhodobacter sp. CCB-MM2]|uniref:hypothetical protein n=1 Tax=Pararhodobacter sp. CCB-MM2 TaxID=1786003 RepID=UPI00082C4F4E|nr:hypothetical protein [Pararhodobacter sp. CCB-MM2]